MSTSVRPVLASVLLLVPASAFAQSITTAPAATVPVGSPWLLLALGLTLVGGLSWMLRRQPLTGRGVGVAGLAVAVGLGAAFVLQAKATVTFSDPAGETLAIPITPETAGDDVEGWEPADFTNDSGAPLLITAIDTPTFSECFPGGLDGDLIAGSSDPSPHPACAVKDTLADEATCRVDVETICRAAADGSLATFASIASASGTTLGGTAVALTGTNLTGATGVTFDGVAATAVTVVNDTTVTATTPAHAPGVVDVVVSTPAGSATLDDGYTFVTTLTFTAVNANSGSASGGVGVTLTGTVLTGATSVTFGGVAATSVNVVSSTTVTAVTPAHVVGAVDVAIATPAGTATLTDGFTYVPTAVGQAAHGGIIATLNGGLNNLIAAVADNSTGIAWGGLGAAVGAQSVTDGASNTAAIVAELTFNQGIPIATYAAGVCSNYEIDSRGNTPCQLGNTCYNDWFLPAGNNLTQTGQLNGLFVNRGVIGGFANDQYWSSTETNFDPNNLADAQQLLDGSLVTASKNVSFRIRCVRAFTP